MTLSSPRTGDAPLRSRFGLLACGLLGLASLLVAVPAQAHHLIEILGLQPTPVNGLLSGLAHPLIGPDHLLFLLALSLVGLAQRSAWMLALLATGLAGSVVGLVLPDLPGAEAAVALSLAVVGLVQLQRLPRWSLVPAFALHGYVLSSSVLGWSAMPVAFYLVGLLLSQGALLLLALGVLRRAAAGLTPGRQRLLAAGLIGCGGAWAWSSLVG
ncbi:MAG: HupE/UreJ family protein [Prochlorococcaceae cyanobacterium]|jgi:urease accessory protein